MALKESGVTFNLYSMFIRVVINKSLGSDELPTYLIWLRSGESAYVAPGMKYNIHGWPTRVTSVVGS